MEFKYQRVQLGTRQAVVVTLDLAANVMLLTDANFSRYERGDAYEYYGGGARKSPAIIYPPRAGTYWLVIDLGGFTGTLNYSVSIVDC